MKERKGCTWKGSPKFSWEETYDVYQAFAKRLHKLGVSKRAIVGPFGQSFEWMMTADSRKQITIPVRKPCGSSEHYLKRHGAA